ncbi:MAG: L,D-transpeptidase family protein [Pseudomonadota bacterium]
MGVRFHGRRIPAVKGSGGTRRIKREGDGATPVGVHRIVGLMYRPDRLAKPVPWAVPIGLRDLWSDDPGDGAYNSLVRAPYAASHERLRRADPLYDVILLTDWNWPDGVPGRGSAIFLHIWRRRGHPTEGCLAFRRDHLLWMLPRIGYGTRIVVR